MRKCGQFLVLGPQKAKYVWLVCTYTLLVFVFPLLVIHMGTSLSPSYTLVDVFSFPIVLDPKRSCWPLFSSQSDPIKSSLGGGLPLVFTPVGYSVPKYVPREGGKDQRLHGSITHRWEGAGAAGSLLNVSPRRPH